MVGIYKRFGKRQIIFSLTFLFATNDQKPIENARTKLNKISYNLSCKGEIEVFIKTSFRRTEMFPYWKNRSKRN